MVISIGVSPRARRGEGFIAEAFCSDTTGEGPYFRASMVLDRDNGSSAVYVCRY